MSRRLEPAEVTIYAAIELPKALDTADALVEAVLGRLIFLPDLAPLPLVDPTEAARYLGIRRHSLACYRSLGEGPPYYKSGRWIRYEETDLRR